MYTKPQNSSIQNLPKPFLRRNPALTGRNLDGKERFVGSYLHTINVLRDITSIRAQHPDIKLDQITVMAWLSSSVQLLTLSSLSPSEKYLISLLLCAIAVSLIYHFLFLVNFVVPKIFCFWALIVRLSAAWRWDFVVLHFTFDQTVISCFLEQFVLLWGDIQIMCRLKYSEQKRRRRVVTDGGGVGVFFSCRLEFGGNAISLRNWSFIQEKETIFTEIWTYSSWKIVFFFNYDWGIHRL